MRFDLRLVNFQHNLTLNIFIEFNAQIKYIFIFLHQICFIYLRFKLQISKTNFKQTQRAKALFENLQHKNKGFLQILIKKLKLNKNSRLKLARNLITLRNLRRLNLTTNLKPSAILI